MGIRASLIICVFILIASAAVPAYAFDIIQIDPEAEREAGGITDLDGVEMPFGDGENDAAPLPESLQNQQRRQREELEPRAQQTPEPDVRRPATQREIEAMSREELFMLAFGGAVARPRNLSLNLIAEGRALGITEVVFSADFSSLEFISPVFSRFLDEIIVPEARSEAGDSVGYFSSRVLTEVGYTVVAYDLMHELHVTLPPEKKRVSRLNLRGGGFVGQPRGEAVEPAFFSSYLNYSLTGSMYYRKSEYKIATLNTTNEILDRSPMSLGLNGAARMFKWTFEGTASLREPVENEPITWDLYRRGDVRLVRDVIPWNSRFLIGDIGLPFGGGIVGGARYEYNRSLFGNNPQDEESGIEFFMPRAGEVEVHIDGVYKQRFYLPAGMHYVSGFGGEQGRNSARLVMRFPDGSFEEIPFEYVLGHPRNLARGRSRLTLATGVRRGSAPSPECFEYYVDEPAISAEYHYGISRRVTAGGGGIVTEYNNIGRTSLSLDMGWLGRTSLQGSANYTPNAQMQTGHRLDVGYTPNLSMGIRRVNRMLGGGVDGRGLLPQFGVSARGYYQSEAYNPNAFSDESPQNQSMAGFSGSLGFGLWRGGISFGGGANYYRKTDADAENYYPMSYNYNVRLSQTIMRIPISVTAGEYVTGNNRRPYFSVDMSHGFGVGAGLGGALGRHQLSAEAGIGTGMAYAPLTLQSSVDPETGEIVHEIVPDNRVAMGMSGSANLSYRYANFGSGVGARRYSANMVVPNIFDPHIPGMTASLAHTYNRAQLSGTYAYTRNNMSFVDMQAHRLGATLTGSFMFADGLWAFGRQTGGSFLLADARHNLKGANVHVDRSHHQMRDYSRNGWLGAAYKNNVAAYHPTLATLTLTDAPPGAFLQNNLFYTTGDGYKQGYALRLGSKEGITIQARFASIGKPVSYAYVTVEREDGKDAARATFTGGNGTLQMGNMAAGVTYRIKFAQAMNIKDVLITVPKDAGLLFEPPVIEVDMAITD